MNLVHLLDEPDPHESPIVHGNCAFTIEALQATVDVLDDRIQMAINYLLQPDVGYGLSPVGVVNVLDILRGDTDE